MVLCIIMMVIFGVLGIFSAKYRTYFKESVHCVGRMLTLRPCDTAFDQEMKNKIVAKLSTKSERFARFVYKRFALLSWIFLIVFVASIVYTGYTVFNLAYYGTCDPANPGNCVFSQGADPNKVTCPYANLEPKSGVPTIGGFLDIRNDTITGKPTIYFFGTTWCPHCNWERPVFINVTGKFGNSIDVKIIELDQNNFDSNSPDGMLFKHYSDKGYIPLIIIGGKYFRVGAGESFGIAQENACLTALMCKATGNLIAECNSTAVMDLVAQIG